MAQKRMFNLKIIDTDLFLEMSASARLLYYDLSMRADDDGFVASPKKIQRMIGASDDDLKILIAKQFIIPFETGICVIRHWRIHNYIQKDRYQETLYLEEKAKIQDDNGTYNILDTECVQNGHEMDTQVRLGKVRVDKNSIDKVIKKEIIPKAAITKTYTENEELNTAITEFISMRKKTKTPFTEHAIKLMIMKLNKIGKSDIERIEIVNNSIMGGYQGIFPLKTNNNSNNNSVKANNPNRTPITRRDEF